MKKIALEDLVTAVCEYFCENITEIQSWYKSTKNTGDFLRESSCWYNKRSQKEKRKISEQLLDIIEKDYKKHGQSANRKRSANKKM